MLFGSKSRDEKLIQNKDTLSNQRKYRNKTKQIKTVKKEKYKGNKYIMAKEQEKEKKRHERIGSIKKDKKRINKQKHERKSSQLQEIIKSKELRKEKLSKLNKEHKLKDLERIQLAKQKSKHRLTRPRSNSDHSSNLYASKPKISFHTPDINKLNRDRETPNIPSIESLPPKQPSVPKRKPPKKVQFNISTFSHTYDLGVEDEEEEEEELPTPECKDIDIDDIGNNKQLSVHVCSFTKSKNSLLAHCTSFSADNTHYKQFNKHI